MPAATVTEPGRTLPVKDTFDVLVAGGGIAGVTAAVAAARNGARVCLVEKQCALGGLATLGVVTIWLPLCDGRGRQVIGGLGEELLKLSVIELKENNPSARFNGIPECWLPGSDPEERLKKRYQTDFNPASYFFALEELIIDEGITLMYDTRISTVLKEDNRITHLVAENKSGRFALGGNVIIDTTGDADICFLAGETTESLDTNVPCGWFYTLHNGKLKLHQHSVHYSPLGTRDGCEGPFFRGDDGDSVTAQILKTRELARTRIETARAKVPDEDIQLIMPATIACMRMTRRICGAFTLSDSHRHQWLDNTVGLTGDWRKPGPVYAIPYGTLYGATRNLLTAGRTISADTTVWDVTRAIPTCTVSGQAAGTAAAMAAKSDADVKALDIAALQGTLKEQGVLLNPELVKEAE